ncbi:ThiF family adenylyltransferase [Nostoc sp. DedQUE07]|uniref:ThiF family adenylyltransferase n=1 Tax=Nostoc sp. DedQUE07 TaxID=3075392 RepID=UPI002AD5A061|nr:ThiF family adenylyltransferase [Nostoc sp. DedQUE07]MDZ8131867.1 ThiF family adenylyltransferase [Nostoc sp. DedQUE07]
MNTSIDTSFLESVPFLVPEWDRIEFMLVGCGGTGSHCAYAIARLMYAINITGKTASATFIDFDIVEEKNIIRQLFCPGDLTRPKAQVLAHRLSLSMGLDIGAINQPFEVGMINLNKGRGLNLIVVVGCVDNAKARIELAKSLDLNIPGNTYRVLWIDGGNHEQSGQILLGNTSSFEDLRRYAFPVNSSFCVGLPAPVLVHPELLVEEQERIQQSLSCAELAASQSLSINLRVAAEINDYLRGIVFGGLRKFATYFDLPTGSSRSIYITKSNLLK